MHGKARAAELWYRHQLRIPVDLKRLVAELSLEVITFPFHGRIREVIIDGVIGVRSGLPRPWFRWYVAHAIGHHVLHVGTSFYLDDWQWVNHAKAERQAEEFAAWLLSGPDGWRSTASEIGIPNEKLSLLRDLSNLAQPVEAADTSRLSGAMQQPPAPSAQSPASSSRSERSPSPTPTLRWSGH